MVDVHYKINAMVRKVGTGPSRCLSGEAAQQYATEAKPYTVSNVCHFAIAQCKRLL